MKLFSKNIYAFLFVILLFLCLPFFLFNSLVTNKTFLQLNPPGGYPMLLGLGILFSFFIDKNLQNTWYKEYKEPLFIGIASVIILYALYLFGMTWYRFDMYVSEAIDVNYFHQTIWQLSEFKIPWIYRLSQPEISVWAQHFSPILYLLVPFYWISKNQLILMNVQSLAVLSGAIPLFLVTKHFLKSTSLGFAMSFAYLAFGGMQYGYGYGFHEIMFFPPLFLWTYYFYITKKIKLYYLFLILSLFVKEEVSFIIIFWSLYLLFLKKDKKHALISLGLGLAWYIVCFQIIFPAFNPGKGFSYWGQYAQNGNNGVFGILLAAISNPITFLTSLVNPSIKIDTFLEVFGSFSFLTFLYPPTLIFIFPALMEKLLSTNIAMANGAHYSAVIGTLICIGTVESIKKFRGNHFTNKYISHNNIFFSVLLFYVALSSNVFYGYIGLSLSPSVHALRSERGLTFAKKETLNQTIQMIPAKATIAAQYQIVPHINRDYKMVTDWPQDKPNEDFIIVDTQLLAVLLDVTQVNKYLMELYNNPSYKIIVKDAGVIVFEKKSFTQPLINPMF